MRRLFALICMTSLLSAPAWAQEGPSWRIGLVAHNIHIGGYGDMQSRETGPNLEVEAVGAPLRGLSWLWTPRPYAMASANLSGDTSFAATGLYWRWRPLRGWTLEPGFGLALHDGALHNRYPDTDPRAADYAHDHQLLGTRYLFRDSLALDRDIGGGRTIGIEFEHLSNGGKLFGHRDNQSLNELGVRFSSPFR
ncbi:MAG: hypothetical protein GC155_04670 [Alphaproteobacteria bacterium]|nr:hypothetical protein [Alphaproteobacteria bacterium]